MFLEKRNIKVEQNYISSPIFNKGVIELTSKGEIVKFQIISKQLKFQLNHK